MTSPIVTQSVTCTSSCSKTSVERVRPPTGLFPPFTYIVNVPRCCCVFPLWTGTLHTLPEGPSLLVFCSECPVYPLSLPSFSDTVLLVVYIRTQSFSFREISFKIVKIHLLFLTTEFSDLSMYSWCSHSRNIPEYLV